MYSFHGYKKASLLSHKSLHLIKSGGFRFIMVITLKSLKGHAINWNWVVGVYVVGAKGLGIIGPKHIYCMKFLKLVKIFS